jgi:NADH:ubiquinone oxidoreductase subunit 3 (subunit A)
MNITLLVLIIFVPLLALILLALNALLAPHKAYEEKLSVYEAGMPVIPGQTRESFQIHYWLVAMLFLVFDIELVLLLPISVSLYHISTYGFVIAIIFFIVLTIGFIFEIGVGALSLKSEQNKHITPTFGSSGSLGKNQNSTNNNKIIFSLMPYGFFQAVSVKTPNSSLSGFFINSPLETSVNSFIPNLLDFLTNSMYLQYISLYFATLATVIFTCKLIIDKNINLEFIKKFFFGKYIYLGITTYISFWALPKRGCILNIFYTFF